MPIPAPDPKQLALQSEDWIEYRTGFPTLVRKFLFRKVPPTGWMHTLGSSLLTVFILQATTGMLLAMTYDPSPNGAYQSIRYITDVQTLGWLIRGHAQVGRLDDGDPALPAHGRGCSSTARTSTRAS